MSTGPLRLRMAIVKLNKLQRMPENMSQLLPTKLTCQKISNCHPKIAGGAKISDHLSSPLFIGQPSDNQQSDSPPSDSSDNRTNRSNGDTLLHHRAGLAAFLG
jgi:hypothetical protein